MKNMKKIIILSLSFVLIFSLGSCETSKDVEDYSKVVAQAHYKYDVSDPNVVVDVFTNIFVAEIISIVETRPYDNQLWGSPVPYTVIEVKVLENIMGEADTKSTIIYYGGFDHENEILYLHGVSEMPQEEQVYLFTVDKITDTTDEREADGEYRVGWHQCEMFLLEGYKKNSKSEDQLQSILDYLSKYKVALIEKNDK